MRHVLATATTVLIAGRVFSLSAFAADLPPRPMNPPAPDSLVPQSAFFVGVGGGWDAANFGNQKVFGQGTSFTPPTGGAITPQIGSAAGSTGLDLDTQTALAPAVQAGYFQHFSGTPWMWGGKFFYSYLNLGSARNGLLIPQSGGFTQDGAFTPFVGNYLVQSYRQTLNQQISFVPFLGRSFERSYLYLGAGPTVAQTKTSIENITGFEAIAPFPTSPTGIGQGSNYSTSQWQWGGIAMVGATYFLDRTWFLDANYSYAMTGTKSSNWGGPWSDMTLTGGATRTGTNKGISSGSVNTQAITVSINAAF
jgi:hypothetical protein